jgi:hypothetical protein
MIAVAMGGLLALIGFLCLSDGIASLGLKSTDERSDQGSAGRAGGK